MKTRDAVLAFIVIVVWGINFTVIKFGVEGVPPMLLVALRFIFAAFPAVLFIKPPDVSWKYVVAFGLTVGVGQFSCLFYAIYTGMPAGIASVVLQSQAFFTILFACIYFKERIRTSQIIGLLVSGVGLFFITGRVGEQNAAPIPISAFFIILAAAFFWGLSNIVVRQASQAAAAQGKKMNVFSMVIWSSLVPPLPMLAASLVLEKPALIWQALIHINALSIFSIIYLAFLATVAGYGLWSQLMSKYPAQKVAPLSLLIPVVGLIAARLILGEELSLMQWAGGAIIIVGLLISNFTVLTSTLASGKRNKK